MMGGLRSIASIKDQPVFRWGINGKVGHDDVLSRRKRRTHDYTGGEAISEGDRGAGDLLSMTGVTGIVDAASYLALGHVFTANMTGNVVLLGFALAGTPGLSVSVTLAGGGVNSGAQLPGERHS